MIAAITAIGGLLGLVVSLLLLTWQTRAVAQQSELANALAGATVLDAAFTALREINHELLDRPELRPHFYGHEPRPTRRGRRQTRVVVMSEMYGDALETGLVATRLVPASESFEAWTNYCRQMLGSSPSLADLVREQPLWWPNLTKILEGL